MISLKNKIVDIEFQIDLINQIDPTKNQFRCILYLTCLNCLNIINYFYVYKLQVSNLEMIYIVGDGASLLS